MVSRTPAFSHQVLPQSKQVTLMTHIIFGRFDSVGRIRSVHSIAGVREGIQLKSGRRLTRANAAVRGPAPFSELIPNDRVE
jgi:hypothetical protein